MRSCVDESSALLEMTVDQSTGKRRRRDDDSLLITDECEPCATRYMDLPRTMGAPAENPSDTMLTAAHFKGRALARERGLFLFPLVVPLGYGTGRAARTGSLSPRDPRG